MRQRSVVAIVDESFLAVYTFVPAQPQEPQEPREPRAVRYYRQQGSGEHRMPVAIFPAGIPLAGEACVVKIEADDRVRLHNQEKPSWRRVPGGRMILRIFRFQDHDKHISRRAHFRLQVGGAGELLARHPQDMIAPVVLAEEGG